MVELSILKLFIINKIYYNKYYSYINNKNVTKEILYIINSIKDYYEEIQEHEYLSSDELRAWFFAHNPNIKDRDLYESIFSRLDTLDISESVSKEIIKNIIECEYGNRILNAIIPLIENTSFGILEKEVKKLLEEFEDVCELKKDEDNPFVDDDLDKLLEENVTGNGINWRLKCLNDDIGPLLGGSLGHVYARVDTGKTSFLASEITFFASQLSEDETILWFNNEEKGSKVKLRTYQAILNAVTASLISNIDKAKEMYSERGGNKIKLYDDAAISFSDIRKLIKKHRPRIVVIDQGDKVHFPKEGDYNNADRLQKIYQMFRELAKEYNCDIITCGQANAEAEGKKWLQLDHMANSKTGKPGELDYGLGIGKSFAEGDEELRFIHICKNKCKNGVHGKHVVLFDSQRARYSDIQ